MSDFAIEIKALNKQYPGSEKKALNKLSFNVEQGAFFGLLGSNGSGKTTLISLLCSLLKADSGEMSVLGKRVDLLEVKSLIGLVPQSIALYPELTLRENLALFAGFYSLTNNLKRHRITESAKFVSLDDCLDKRVSTFSGGMLRRANLAAGLLHSPKLLFLDEPTVNVDVQTRLMIFDCLKEINQSGTTIIYTTHYLEEIEILCRDLAILEQGELIAHTTLEQLKSSSPGASLADIYLNLVEQQRGEQ